MKFYHHLSEDLDQIKDAGLFKQERVISSPQGPHIKSLNKDVINMCANNYLGLSNHPDIINCALKALNEYGFGMSSVRFICGTQDIHKQLEEKISNFLGMEDTILYSSCWDANGGLFETIFSAEDAIISDALNHASIIDGIRLCKASRYRYKNNDMEDLESMLQKAQNSRFRIIVTDGVFSMDGHVANLRGICDLASKYDALVMVDDSHAVGFMGETGAGTPEYCGVKGRVDILTGTFGKALGGASGGYTAAKKEVVEMLRQKSRPYLFSNTLAPVIVKTTLKVLELLSTQSDLREKLWSNTAFLRSELTKMGFKLIEGDHPIIPIMLGDARLADEMARGLMERGVYVVGFSYPVVPREMARIRLQLSAAHQREDLEKVLEGLNQVGKKFNVI
jgi:glycine C-acetyltransferase